MLIVICGRKGLLTQINSGSESEKVQTTSKKDPRINDKHQRKFSPSLPLSLGVNELLNVLAK